MTTPGSETDQVIYASEVFSAIQGEAALVGERQLFVRLAGCNIRCTYCDQPEALERVAGPCRIEQTPGRRDWTVVASPLAVDQLVDHVVDLWGRMRHHSISLTGGEPLFQSQRVVPLVERLAAAGCPLMVETNGTLVSALDRVAPWLTYVSMDLKLDSVDGEAVSLDTQRTFLAHALDASLTTWVKIILGPTTADAEFDRAVAMVADTQHELDPSGPGVEIFLQPVTPFGRVTAAPTPEQVLEWQERALRVHPRVRVVPQTHKAIGQL